MAGRSMVNQRFLLQKETTPGTPVITAMKEVLGLRITPGFTDEGEDFKASGYKVNTARIPNSETGTHTVDTIQDYNALLWVLTGGYGAPTSTAVTDATGDATEHVFELKPKAADTLVTFTGMWGDATQTLQLAHFLFNSLGLTIQRGSLSVSTSAISYEPSTGVALPSSGVEEVGAMPIAGRQWDVYCDDTWADLGTTKLLAAYEGSFDLGTKYSPDWVINSAKTSFDSVMETTDANPVANLTLGFDATAVGLTNTFKSGALKFLRFKSTGPKIDATSAPEDINASLQFDFCVRIASRGQITAAPNSPAVALPFTCQITADPTSGNASKATLVNLVEGL